MRRQYLSSRYNSVTALWGLWQVNPKIQIVATTATIGVWSAEAAVMVLVAEVGVGVVVACD